GVGAMNPDDEEPKPAAEEPTASNAEEPQIGAHDAPAPDAPPQDPPARDPPPQDAAPADPPSAEIVEANEAEIAPELEPRPEPQPQIQPAPPEPARVLQPEAHPLLQEPLAAAYAHGHDEPMSDDAFQRVDPDNEEPVSSLFGTPQATPDIRFPGEGRAR